MAEERRRFGAMRLRILLHGDGLVVNRKRTERIYREERLSLRLKHRNKRPSAARTCQILPSAANEKWAMDFVSDSHASGWRIRILTILDLWDRSSPALEADVSLTCERVIQTLERLRLQGRMPQRLLTANGPEFSSRALDEWAKKHGVCIEHTRQGKPADNSFMESFNGKLRDECLNQNVFSSLREARNILEELLKEYNCKRPHSV